MAFHFVSIIGQPSDLRGPDTFREYRTNETFTTHHRFQLPIIASNSNAQDNI